MSPVACLFFECTIGAINNCLPAPQCQKIVIVATRRPDGRCACDTRVRPRIGAVATGSACRRSATRIAMRTRRQCLSAVRTSRRPPISPNFWTIRGCPVCSDCGRSPGTRTHNFALVLLQPPMSCTIRHLPPTTRTAAAVAADIRRPSAARWANRAQPLPAAAVRTGRADTIAPIAFRRSTV